MSLMRLTDNLSLARMNPGHSFFKLLQGPFFKNSPNTKLI